MKGVQFPNRQSVECKVQSKKLLLGALSLDNRVNDDPFAAKPVFQRNPTCTLSRLNLSCLRSRNRLDRGWLARPHCIRHLEELVVGDLPDGWIQSLCDRSEVLGL